MPAPYLSFLTSPILSLTGARRTTFDPAKREAPMSDPRAGWRRAIWRAIGLLGVAMAVTGWITASGASRQDAPRETPTRPVYNQAGELIAPRGFRTWVFVGADLSPVYKRDMPETTRRELGRNEGKEAGSFHNIYINPESYRAFLDTGKFPDPTILVMEVFRAETKDAKGILASGEVEGKRVSFEVAVKDKDHPHDCVPWAYYAFDLDAQGKPSKPATAAPKTACYDCHLKHASVDNVWVQFYPALRDPE
jgi:hypothetical protein